MAKYCVNCGNEIDQNAFYCVKCGVLVDNKSVNNNTSEVFDSGSIWWGILGFFIPLVGLILYLTWKDDKPKNAKIAGKGALISVICGVVIYIIMMIVFGIIFGIIAANV